MSLCLSLFPHSAIVIMTIGAASIDIDVSTEQWREDLAFIVQQIRSIHPHPFCGVAEEDFDEEVSSLHEEIPELEDGEVLVRLMELVGSVRDGHTRLVPNGSHGFRRWFPVRFHAFTDGIYVTVAEKRNAHLIAAEVLEFEGAPAVEVFEATQRLVAGDNEFRKLAMAPIYLSNGDALTALGFSDTPDRLHLRVRTKDGTEVEAHLEASSGDFSSSWFWRLLGAPPSPEGATENAVAPWSDDAPIHLRHQEPFEETYWFEYLPEDRILYFQLNGWWDQGAQSFVEFNKDLWKAHDQNEVDCFVWDLRYNGGGDGSMFKPMFLEILRRPELHQPGRFVVLTGHRTFSASLNAIGDLLKLVDVTLIGEPPSAGLNMYGDARSITLPRSRCTLYVSEYFWQKGFPADERRVLSPHVPAVFSSEDFFSGRDPAMDLVRSGQHLGLQDRFRLQGAEAALKWLRNLDKDSEVPTWWVPFGEREFNSLGYELLEAGKVEESQAAFTLVAERYPRSWNAWDSLGEAHMKARDFDRAKEAYRTSLSLNPGNSNARRIIAAIDEARVRDR